MKIMAKISLPDSSIIGFTVFAPGGRSNWASTSLKTPYSFPTIIIK